MKQQLHYYLTLLLTLPLLPILYLQARHIRATVPRLPEPEETQGLTGNGPRPLRLLTLGESTVAGVGMPHHADGFTGWIARHLAEHTGTSVEWQVLGRSGYTAARVRDELVPLMPAHRLDLVVIGLGGNDTFNLHSPLRWRRDMIGLIEAVQRGQPDCPIVIASLPPIGQFPALPRLMRRFLGRLVRLHGEVIGDLPVAIENVHYAARPIRVEDWIEHAEGARDVSELFCDGVHPSSLTYRIWAREIVELVRRRGLLGM